MSHPTVVIIPTSFCSSSLYDGQVKFLREKGYSAHAIDPPSYPANYKPETPASSMYDDAKFIGDYITKLADDGADVVVLGHSYGACPASQSLKGLTKSERTATGKPGGVVRMAYLTGVVPSLGQNTIATVTASPSGGAPQVEVDRFGWMSQTNTENTVKMAFNALTLEKGLELSKLFGRHAAPAFAEPLTHAGYQEVPVSWYFCEDDRSVVPEVQQNAIKTIEESWEGTTRSGNKVDVTTNKCDHMPMFSAPDHLNAWLEKVILKGGDE